MTAETISTLPVPEIVKADGNMPTTAQIVSTVCLTALGVAAIIVDGDVGKAVLTFVGAGFGTIIGFEFAKR